jgi:hypothetical protein
MDIQESEVYFLPNERACKFGIFERFGLPAQLELHRLPRTLDFLEHGRHNTAVIRVNELGFKSLIVNLKSRFNES